MATIRFTAEEFEGVLKNVCDEYSLTFVKDGYRGNELRYHVLVKTLGSVQVCVDVNSTIGRDGFADPAGEDSIRMWVTDSDGNPLGNKVGKWTTRQAGWEDRVTDKLGLTIEMADAIEICQKCNTMEKVFVVKKDGPNKGRVFIRCNCPKRFVWLDTDDDGEPVKAAAADAKDPVCPMCGSRMRLRNRRDGSGQFWGCSMYPACRGIRDVKETLVPLSPVHQVANLLDNPAKPKTFEPSKYHFPIIEWVKDQTAGKALVVEARAGSGKTTTSLELAKLLDPALDIVFLAFNKHNVVTLRERAPGHLKVVTYHSLGFSACRHLGKEITVEEDKVVRILDGLLDKFTYGGLFPDIKRLVSLVKANLVEPTEENLNFLADRHGIELNGSSETVFAAVELVIEECKNQVHTVDYDDMCWLPIALDLPVVKYDFIFIDEAQDTNKCQIALALRSLKDGGRVLAVGDSYQSMYGFRGADVDAIPNLISELSAKVLPLSITYRNPKCIVRLVNEKFPEIDLEAAPWAQEGTIRNISDERALMEYAPGDMIICRCNAPLVAPAFRLIARGVKAVIRGRDIGKGLQVLVRKMKAHDMPELLSRLGEYRRNETEKLLAAGKNQQAQSVDDKVETLVALSDGVYSISELEDRIENIFSDDAKGVVFSSVHRAKGLEAERIYILQPNLMPHKMAKKDWEIVQERNIMYVAYTRTLNELIFVN